ncbi:hypothetical protein DL93DRAFT_2089853 [Clavulina sp. PMI_390]|nr:hypothetical protein DL93DRAFT_2089853 [Clavulina sp. PMI_390]
MPEFKHAAQLEPTPRYVDGYWEHHLEANYCVMETIDSIIVWDWKDNMICQVDGSHCDWAGGSGFLMASLPPFLFIFPNGMREILVAEFPPLYPVGSHESFNPMKPRSEVSYPCVDTTGSLGVSDLYVIDRWRPPSRRSGINVLRSHRLGRGDRSPFYVVSLRPRDNTVPLAPFFVDYPGVSLATAAEDVNSATVLDGAGVLFLQALPQPVEDADTDSLMTRFYQFTEVNNLGSPVQRRFDSLIPFAGIPTPLCFVSGTALLERRQDTGAKPYSLVVGIVSLSFK